MNRPVLAAWSAIVAGTLAGCGPDEVTLPTPPMAAETAQLVSVYNMPTAVLDPANVDEAMAAAQARLDDLHVDWLPDVVSDALTGLRRRLDEGGLDTDPQGTPNRARTQITAVIDVRRICAGWDNPVGAPDEVTNGAIDVTAIVDAGRINPEIWGTTTSCRVRFPRADVPGLAMSVVSSTVVRATLAGTLTVYLLGPVPTRAIDAQMLVSFNGTIAVSDGAPKSVAFDFELVNGKIRYRIPAGGGDAIVTVGLRLGIQGANAGFSCDALTGTCQPT